MTRQRPSRPPITQTTGFWELRAEQVMDRVFGGRPDPGVHHPASAEAAAPAIDVLVREALPDTPAITDRAPEPATKPPRPSPAAAAGGPAAGPSTPQLLLWGSLFCLPLLVLVGVLLRNLNHSETALNQERNLLLLERLRAIQGPGQGAATAPAADGQRATGNGDGLPPPPPSEDWMTELGQLPQSGAPQAEVLRVPPSRQITAAAPPAGHGSTGGGGGPLPVLVGVIQAPGRGGSAIFQVGGASASAAIGESIGSSGWRLRSASGDSALIERGGEQRRLSISTGL